MKSANAARAICNAGTQATTPRAAAYYRSYKHVACGLSHIEFPTKFTSGIELWRKCPRRSCEHGGSANIEMMRKNQVRSNALSSVLDLTFLGTHARPYCYVTCTSIHVIHLFA